MHLNYITIGNIFEIAVNDSERKTNTFSRVMLLYACANFTVK